jgi:cell division protein FtsB
MEEKKEKKVVRNIVIGSVLLSFGSFLVYRNYELKKENSRLRGINETLTKEREILSEQIKKDWYFIGKIITGKIIRARTTQ